MCAIIDANVAHEVFSGTQTQAGSAFWYWLESGKGTLVSGGKQLRELEGCSEGYRKWASVAAQRGVLHLLYDEHSIDRCARKLKASGDIESNDAHVLALAQLSGAHLLMQRD